MGKCVIYQAPFTESNMRAIINSINNGSCPQVPANPTFKNIFGGQCDVNPCNGNCFRLVRTDKHIFIHTGYDYMCWLCSKPTAMEQWLQNLVEGVATVTNDDYYNYEFRGKEVVFNPENYLETNELLLTN